MNYPSYPGNIIDVDYVEVSPVPYSMDTGLLPWHASAKMKRVIKEAMVQRTHDQCLALLAKAGLEHTAALSKIAGIHQHGPAESGAIPGDCGCLCTAGSRQGQEVVRCL